MNKTFENMDFLVNEDSITSLYRTEQHTNRFALKDSYPFNEKLKTSLKQTSWHFSHSDIFP